MRRRRAAGRGGVLVLVVLLMAGDLWGQQVTGDGRRFYPDDPLWTDPDDIDLGGVELVEHELSMQYDFLENTLGDPARHDGPAVNVNTLGEVPDSSWFENRLGLGRIDRDQAVRGPLRGDGPQPPLVVIGRPGSGITPKFTVRDSRGDTYLLKMDPPDWPGLASTAEFVASKLFWAAGYHVPENHIHWLDPAGLTIRDGATWRTVAGYRRPIREAEIEEWLHEQPRDATGRIRVLASRFIDGRPIGPRKFYATRPDDPNDIFPHELRREVRALRVFSAWLNHDDSRSINSFDALLEHEGRRYVRHYLIDFGSTLGSRGTDAQERRAGYEYMVEFDNVLKRLFTLGIHREGWESVEYPDLPAIGRLEADYYEPWLWKPQYPNPAFDRMDAADAFWAAAILSRFDDALLRGVVEGAVLPDPVEAEYLIETLIRRRDDTVRYWIARTNPLWRFAVEGAGDRSRLTFGNAAVELSAAAPGERYEVAWARLDNLANHESPVSAPIVVTESVLRIPASSWGPPDDVGDRYAVARIGVLREDRPAWAEPIVVTLRERAGVRSVVGVTRPPQTPAAALAPPDARPR